MVFLAQIYQCVVAMEHVIHQIIANVMQAGQAPIVAFHLVSANGPMMQLLVPPMVLVLGSIVALVTLVMLDLNVKYLNVTLLMQTNPMCVMDMEHVL